MAFILFLAGGIAGIAAMFISIFVFDASLLSALAVWFATGMAISLGGVALAMMPRATLRDGHMVEA